MTRSTCHTMLTATFAAASLATMLTACGSGGDSSTGGSPASTGGASSELHAMLPEDIQKSGVVTVGTDAEYPPCESLDGKAIVGYEPDLYHAMAGRLGIKIEDSSVAFDGLIPAVQSKRFDIAMSCFSDNLDREKVVTFVDDAYATGAVYMLASNTSITSDPLTLCGLKTAVQQGLDLAEQLQSTINPHCTKNGKEPVDVQQFPSGDAALLALYSGRVDFVLNDYAAADALQKAAPKPLRLVTNPLLQKYYNGMIFNKEDTQLQQAFLAALKAIVADGTYEKIMKKWGLPDLMLTEPGINVAASKPIPTPTP
jgi:polar amino acid transport system substrate-binding protein